jgi:L-alanine-DL-glutamate epimerase-like enolase superfamily enzyme
MTCSLVAVITDVVIQEMRSYLDRGYTVVKMKIGGVTLEEDQRRIDAVFGELGPGQRLAVDANGRLIRERPLPTPTHQLAKVIELDC